jgi:hypothetical protein
LIVTTEFDTCVVATDIVDDSVGCIVITLISASSSDIFWLSEPSSETDTLLVDPTSSVTSRLFEFG